VRELALLLEERAEELVDRRVVGASVAAAETRTSSSAATSVG